jgi:Spy/CpxP family protein refolding chaperone
VTAAAAATPTTAVVSPVATATHGRVKDIADALSVVALRTDQRTEIEQLATAAEARQVTAKAAHGAVMSLLADQIEAGKIDRAALQSKIDLAMSAHLQSRPLDHAAFERLHAILDASQRAAFVDAMEAKGQERRAAHRGHGDPLASWATDLKLTDDQQDQIRTALRAQWLAHKAAGGEGHGEWKKMHEHGKAMLEAFRGETFSMAQFAPPDMSANADRMTDHMTHVAEIALPLLTAEQRSLAAAKLRSQGVDQGPEGEP